jgi:Carboxypeptidase regulatory-like domain/TonB dependent receptor
MVFFAGNVAAQAVAGLAGISGVVRDATGSAVPKATVTVSNELKGIRRTLETNDAGVFTAPALVPSDGYKVVVSKSGFANYEADKIEITVGQNINLQITLGVATAATAIDISAAAQIIDDSKTEVSQLVDAKQILELPINGRRVDSFVLLSPAVAPDGAFGLLSFRGVAGHNSFLTDGNDTTNQYYNENAGRTRITSQISQDAVQEFQVITDNFAAEYGRAMGGIVNTVTKSGTNSLHGTAYWFFRNRTLEARDPFATYNPPEWRNQVGGSLGGAIKKDKLFYFFNYEKLKRNFPLVSSITTPPLFDANGNFVYTQPGGVPTCGAPATVAQCNAATSYIATRDNGLVPRTVDQDLAFGKIDYRPSERNTFSFSLNYLRWVSPNGIQTASALTNGGGIGNNANSTVRTRYGRAVWTGILSPSIVNEARFGWFKDRLFDADSPDFVSATTGRAGLTINSVANLGYATSYPRTNPSENRFQYADSLTMTKGRHTMKFGVDISSTEDYYNSLSNQFGSYSYATFTNFALDYTGNTAGNKNWTTFSQSFGNPIVDPTLHDYGLFAQDTFRITPKLLLNYGIRYDKAQIPQPTIVNPDYPQTGVIHSSNTNFAPRLGAAYSINEKTVIRGGYGLFFARIQTGLINTFFLNNNVYQKSLTFTNTTLGTPTAAGPVFPNYLPSTNLTPPPGTTDITFADPNLRTPYTHQANLSVERELGNGLSMTVSYLWSRGVQLYTIRDLNAGPLGAPITYKILDFNNNVVNTYTTPTYRGPHQDPRYRRIDEVDNGGLSYYDALAVQFNKRFARGFQGGLAYTFGHAIDFNQGAATNNIFFSSGPTSYDNGNYAAEKGSAANDVRHRVVINFVWEPTLTHSNSGFARFALKGWQISQITTMQSSQPVTGSVTISGAAFTGALFTGSLNGLGGTNRVPFLPVGNLDLDRIYRVDARLTKAFNFTERFRLNLEFEAFNLTNSPYYTSRQQAQYALTVATASLVPQVRYGQGSATAAFPDGTNARRAQAGLRFIF